MLSCNIMVNFASYIGIKFVSRYFADQINITESGVLLGFGIALLSAMSLTIVRVVGSALVTTE